MDTVNIYQSKNNYAVAFVWASAALQANGTFLAQQQHLIRTYANNKGIKITCLYSCCSSHNDIDKRLADWNQLLQFIASNKGKISFLLVASLLIIHPVLKTAQQIVNELKEQFGVTVITVVPPGQPVHTF